MIMDIPSTKAIIQESWTKTLVVGHRGAAAYKPENTLPAFEEGIACLASAVECDVYTSKDGELMVMHDATLDRTTKLKGKVMETDAATMKAGGVPTLDELTDLTKDRVVLIIEIKDGVEIEKKVTDMIARKKMEDQTIIFSFETDHIRKAEDLNPSVFSVWLVGRKLDPTNNYASLFDEIKTCGSNGLGLSYSEVTPEVVKAAKDQHIPVFVWTVPPGDQVDRLKLLGVNFIITNHPRDVRTQLGL
ncbi:glycerophosphodiester phosphodiesterase [soil metagenome]